MLRTGNNCVAKSGFQNVGLIFMQDLIPYLLFYHVLFLSNFTQYKAREETKCAWLQLKR